jgi:hypothetical protein
MPADDRLRRGPTSVCPGGSVARLGAPDRERRSAPPGGRPGRCRGLVIATSPDGVVAETAGSACAAIPAGRGSCHLDVRASARPRLRTSDVEDEKTSGSAHRCPHLLQPRRARRPAHGVRRPEGTEHESRPSVRAARAGGREGSSRTFARFRTPGRCPRVPRAARPRRGTWARGRRRWWRMARSRRRSPGRRPAPGRPSEHRAATPSTPVRTQGRPEPRTRSVTACRTWRSSSACSRRASSP